MVLMTVAAGAVTPGYSHFSQFISELGARGSSTEWAVRFAGFLPAGLLMLAFCACAHQASPRSLGFSLAFCGMAIYAGGYLVAAAFPCDLGCRPAHPSTSQLVHNIGGAAGYFLAPAFLLTLARATRSGEGAGHLVVAGYIAAGLALLGLLTLSPSSAMVGLSQRLIEGAVLGWAALYGVHLARRAAAAT